MPDRAYVTADGVTLKPGDTCYAYDLCTPRVTAYVISDDGAYYSQSAHVGGGYYIPCRRLYSTWERAREEGVWEENRRINEINRRIADAIRSRSDAERAIDVLRLLPGPTSSPQSAEKVAGR